MEPLSFDVVQICQTNHPSAVGTWRSWWSCCCLTSTSSSSSSNSSTAYVASTWAISATCDNSFSMACPLSRTHDAHETPCGRDSRHDTRSYPKCLLRRAGFACFPSSHSNSFISVMILIFHPAKHCLDPLSIPLSFDARSKSSHIFDQYPGWRIYVSQVDASTSKRFIQPNVCPTLCLLAVDRGQTNPARFRLAELGL